MLRRFVTACVVCLAAAGAARAQLVTNGNFNNPPGGNYTPLAAGNTGGLIGWTVDLSPTGGVAFGTAWGVPGVSSTQALLLATTASGSNKYRQGGIQQSIETVPGQAYQLSLYGKDVGTVINSTGTAATVSFGAASFSLSSLTTSWSPIAWTETAGSASTLINFVGYLGNGGTTIGEVAVADFSVTAVPTVWSGSASSDWGTAANWASNFVPNAAAAAAGFGASGANANVSLASGSRTVGILAFFSFTPTTISGGGNNLILDNTGGGSSATVTVSGSHSISANVKLNSPTAFAVTSGTDQLTISGVMADGVNGPQGVTLSGSGRLNLAGANTMSGSVSVNSGTLLLSNNAALQNATLAGGGVSFANGATSGTFGALAGNGNFALSTTSGQPVALFVGNNGQNTNFGGSMGGNGSLTKIGSGALTLGGANTFTGTTYVSSGTLTVGTPLALQNSPLNPGGSGTFSFGSQTAAALGGLTATGTLNLANVSMQPVALTLNTAGNLNFGGQLTGGSSVTMSGGGVQVLSGNNSYTGGSNITSGMLQFQGANALPSGAIGLGGGTVSIASDGTGSGGTISLGNNITVTAAVSTTPTVGIDVRNNGSGNTNNVVSFGTLSNGTPANAIDGTINFTAANGYRLSFLGLNLPGSTGYSTLLNPTGTTLSILGNVTNQMSPTATGQYDTLDLDGTSPGNIIYGAIADSSNFGGVNDGDTRITKTNSSQWILAGTGSTYSGPTLVSGGTLQLGTGKSGQDGTLGNSGVASGSSVTNNAVLAYDYFAGPGANTASYPISGSGTLSVIGPGGVTLAASNTYTGPTNISNGTLALGSNGAIAQSSTISLAGGATFDVSQVNGGTLQLATGQTLSGTGNYTVNGALAVASSSTLLPGGVASAGTLNVGGLALGGGTTSFDLSTSATLDLINVGTAYGGLDLNGGSIGLYQSNGTTAFTTPGTYLLMNYGNGNSISGSLSNLSVLNPASTNVYTFTATGGSLDITIRPPNIWSGGGSAPFNWSSGSNWTSGAAPSSGTSVMFAGTAGTSNTNNLVGLSLSGIFFSPTAGAFNISGNSVQLGGQVVNLSTSAQTIGLGIVLSGNQNVIASAGSIILNGVIADGGAGYGINVSGGGTVVLGAANTYSGTTNVSGPLRLANNAALQNSTLDLLSGGSLSFAAGVTAPSIAGLAGTGSITLSTSTAQPVTLNVGGSGQSSTFGGSLKGPGSLVKQGGGTFALAGSQTYTGTTLINGGVLQLAGVTGFGVSGAGWTLSSTNSTLPSVSNDQLTLTFNTGNEARSAFQNQKVPLGAFYASFDYQASGNKGADGVAFVLQNSTSGAGALGATGGGLGYAGITPSAAVEINIYSTNGIGTNYETNGTTGTYLSTTPVNPGSGNLIQVTLSYDGGSSLTETMSDTTTGQVYKNTYTNANLASAVGAAAYIGFTGGDGGVLSTQTISNFSYKLNNILPTSTALSIANGGTFDMTNCLQTVLSLSSTDGNGSQVLVGNGALTVANTAGTSTTFDGVISGGGGSGPTLIVQGGQLILTGQNTYTGATTVIGAGTLQLATGRNGDGSINGTSMVNDFGTLVYNFGDSQTVGYSIAGGGNVRLTGGGALTLTATSSYTGATVINGGTLQLGTGQGGQDGSINSSVGGVLDKGALVYDLAGTQSAAYAISGSGSLTMDGPGMLTLSGTNTYTGATLIESGTVVATNVHALPNGTNVIVGNPFYFSAVAPAAAPSAAAVPEPGTVALLAAAGAMLMLRLTPRRPVLRKKQAPELI